MGTEMARPLPTLALLLQFLMCAPFPASGVELFGVPQFPPSAKRALQQDCEHQVTAVDELSTDFPPSWIAGAGPTAISNAPDGPDLLLRTRFAPAQARGDLEAFRLPVPDPLPPDHSPLWSAAALLDARVPATRHILTPADDTAHRLLPLRAAGQTLSYFEQLWGLDATATANTINAIRALPLGTIIHSAPLVVGAPQAHHRAEDYAAFRHRHQRRPTLIYAGANNGMLHAFYAFGGPNTPAGSEAWAYLPASVQQRLGNTPENGHRYLVDLAPMAADARDSAWGFGENAWKTVLIGGSGLGGPGYFALDITKPTPQGVALLWEAHPFSGARASTRPVIGPILPTKRWAALFTSGVREDDQRGGLRALALSDATALPLGPGGARTLHAGVKGEANPYYTLSDPVAIDSSGDGYLDLIYAGDSEGLLWKFFYDAQIRAWRATARFDTGGRAISGRPTLAFDGRGDLRVYFGTGRYLIDAEHDDSHRNAFYGLIERRRKDHPAHPFGQTPFAPQTPAELTDVTGLAHENAVHWLKAEEKEKLREQGWYFLLDPPAGNPAERITATPLVVAGVVFFTSFTPTAGPCGFGAEEARLYAVSHDSGIQARHGRRTVLRHGKSGDLPAGRRYERLGSGTPGGLLWRFGSHGQPGTLLSSSGDTSLRALSPTLPARPTSLRAWRELLP